jgi:hypothetical protein
MNQRWVAAVQAGLLLAAVCANAAVKNNIRIKVLDSETRSVTIDGGNVPKNCDQANFDAYCNNSKAAEVTNTMLVQEGDNPPFRISCAIESKWSRCIPLQKGESFEAKRVKHGLVVYYVDDKGKARSQLYAQVDGETKSGPPATLAAVAPQPAPVPTTVAPRQSSPAKASSSPDVAARVASPEKIKCTFTSTPAGAEITLDGKYAGNTPSEISLSPGTHAVELFMPGFALWKRDLTVFPGSDLTVSTILQKQP